MKIIFLDIDGPVIPSYMYIIDRNPSFKRKFSPVNVALLNQICLETDAKIVFNTTHNGADTTTGEDGIQFNETIVEAAVRNGIPSEYIFNEDPKTSYVGGSGHFRLTAVGEWLANHPEVESYVAFDDVTFSQQPWMVTVSFDHGIDTEAYNKAMNHFGYRGLGIIY